MLVVPRSSHAKVDTCSRRAACEKHCKNRYENKVFIYHVDHNSSELLMKFRNRRIRTRPSRRRSILSRFESDFGEDFDSKNDDKLGYEFD